MSFKLCQRNIDRARNGFFLELLGRAHVDNQDFAGIEFFFELVSQFRLRPDRPSRLRIDRLARLRLGSERKCCPQNDRKQTNNSYLWLHIRSFLSPANLFV